MNATCPAFVMIPKAVWNVVSTLLAFSLTVCVILQKFGDMV